MTWEQVGALIGAVVAIVFIGFVLLAFRLRRLLKQVEGLSHDVDEVRTNLSTWEKELRTVRAESQNMRGELQGTRGELQNLRAEMHDHWATMTSVKQALHWNPLGRTDAGAALPLVSTEGPASEPGRTTTAVSQEHGQSTVIDWLRQETLRRLSR
ncbi:hypothetical protein [Verrucomicrobium sp. 3C]|uniref:hypothetical protein n=1 Tax=Verrucomicrobium sp. 3C TaxID=1134055 RepID=UPI00035DD9FA|nr:hypothetical protein [Verrucomicrobium sp. 3C]